MDTTCKRILRLGPMFFGARLCGPGSSIIWGVGDYRNGADAANRHQVVSGLEQRAKPQCPNIRTSSSPVPIATPNTKVVRVEGGPSTNVRELRCVCCTAALQAREETFILKYFLVGAQGHPQRPGNLERLSTLVSYRQRRRTSGPIPKFASARVTFRCELRNLRTTSNFMILVRF